MAGIRGRWPVVEAHAQKHGQKPPGHTRSAFLWLGVQVREARAVVLARQRNGARGKPQTQNTVWLDPVHEHRKNFRGISNIR